jgi:putative cell wall-binding protein
MATVVALLAAPASGAITGAPEFLREWGEPGTDAGQFDLPYDAAFAPDGTIYVADAENDRIQQFSASGDFLGEFGEFGNGDGQMSSPTSVAVAADGTVYATDYHNDRVQFFTPGGTYLGEWGGFGTGEGEFDGPFSIAVAPDGTVYVTDFENDRVQYFDATGSHLGEWGATGTGDREFRGPLGVALAEDGTVYVADQSNNRVQYFNATGDYLGQWGGPGSGPGDFNSPAGIAVARDGTVLVSDIDNDRVQAFTSTGGFVTEWGTPGTDPGQLNNPAGIAVDQFDRVLIADLGNHRVQMFVFPQVMRLAGANRYATAAEISELHRPLGNLGGTTYIATGGNFPDALAGAALVGDDTLLLAGSVPDATADELDRLSPDDIVIFGGTAVIDQPTADELATWGDVTRLAGANRYDTAIAISEAWGNDATTVTVASGLGFADALAGVPLAWIEDGPILLTPPDTLPASVATRIAELDPDEIFLLGGTAAVSDAVFDALDDLAPTTRIAGANRYATAVAISNRAFPDGAGIVYLAVGTNFPDALAAAGPAGYNRAPVLLTPTAALPQEVIDEIQRLDPHAIVILGGTAAISANVQAQLEALLD